MILNDLLDLVNKEKRKRERVKTAQRFAIGMGVMTAVGGATGILFAPKSGKEIRKEMKKKAINTIETIKDTVQKNVDTVKDSAVHAVEEVNNAIDDVREKTESVKKDIKEGRQEIIKDINKTVKNISNELNESAK